MQFNYDESTGIYSLQIADKKIVESDIKRNIVIDYGDDGNVVGIEFFPFDVEQTATRKKLKVA